MMETLCQTLACNFQMDRPGSVRMRISVTKFGMPFAINATFRSMHVPGVCGSHAFFTGVHWNIATRSTEMSQARVIPPRM